MIFTRSAAHTGSVRLATESSHSSCWAAVWILAALGILLRRVLPRDSRSCRLK
jgi:hypothetical protein